MVADARRERFLWKWVPALFALVGIGLLPWTLWLSVALPSHHLARHWDLAWAGFDVLLMSTLLGTAVAAVRRSPSSASGSSSTPSASTSPLGAGATASETRLRGRPPQPRPMKAI